MYTKLNNLVGERKKNRKRVGRGQGSGVGKTCGKGQKGQKSRSGVSLLGFEGGQTPIFRRLPKRGFNNTRFENRFAQINLIDLNRAQERGSLDFSKPITSQELIACGVLRNNKDKIKLLAKGKENFNLKINIKVDKYSASAKETIEKFGGSIA